LDPKTGTRFFILRSIEIWKDLTWVLSFRSSPFYAYLYTQALFKLLRISVKFESPEEINFYGCKFIVLNYQNLGRMNAYSHTVCISEAQFIIY
jgi:hypothetical protein